MGLYTGNYSRNMYDEENEYLRSLVQQGIPWVDADENDTNQSLVTQIRRLSQMIGCGAIGDGFHITADGSSLYDFIVTGGDGTLDGAARFILQGYVPLLRDSVNYLNTGTDLSETSLFPKITHIVYDSLSGNTTLEDSAANWGINEHVGKTIYPDVTSGYTTTVISNTQNTMVLSGDATSGGAEIGSFYRIGLTDTGGSRTDGVFLNVYVDEYDATDDPNLEHQLATPTVAQLRSKLVHTIYVKEGSESFPDYVDVDGNQHYTYELARINRNGSPLTDGHIEDLRSVAVDSMQCEASAYKWMNSVNLITNGSFDSGCLTELTDGGLFMERTWGFWTEAGGTLTSETAGPDFYPYIALTLNSGKGQIYQTLPVNTGFARVYPITLAFDVRITTLTTDGSYEGVSPLGTPYSGRVLYGSSVHYLYNSDLSLNSWRRITVQFPAQPINVPQISLEFGPNVVVNIARVACVVGETSNLPPVPSGKLVPKRSDTKVMYQDFLSDTWVIQHRLGTRLPVFHIWDNSGISLMERYSSVVFNDENTMTVTFDEALAGKIVFTANVCNASPYKEESYQSGIHGGAIPNAEAYAMVVTADSSYNLVEYDSAIQYPNSRAITVTTLPSGVYDVVSNIVAGIDKVHKQTVASGSWVIQHNLSTRDLIIRCYDDSGEAIPGTIEITDEDTVTFTCSPDSTGYALIKAHKMPDTGIDESTHNVPIWRVGISTSGTTTSDITLLSPEDVQNITSSSVFTGGAVFEFNKGGTIYRFHAHFNGQLVLNSSTISEISSNFYGGEITTASLDGYNVPTAVNNVIEDVTGYVADLPEGTGDLFRAYLYQDVDNSVKCAVTSKVDWLHQQIIISMVVSTNHVAY